MPTKGLFRSTKPTKPTTPTPVVCACGELLIPRTHFFAKCSQLFALALKIGSLVNKFSESLIKKCLTRE
ncbi:MAG: hypothetical protein NY202_00545 [Mollicutes bacterium UO1]